MNPTIRIITIAFFAAFTLLPVRAQVPNILNYQGRVTVGGTNYNGTGQFKFALVRNDNTFVWRNDGAATSGEPATAVGALVQQGLYATLLGDTTLSNMAAIPAEVFTNSNIGLRVWFSAGGTNPFVLLTPDQRIGASGYALRAATAESAAVANVTGDLSVGGTLTAGKVIGGSNNTSSLNGTGAVIAGGEYNTANFPYATIGGGQGNEARDNATVAGGQYNTARGDSAAISGGFLNYANGDYSFVGGGFNNTNNAAYAVLVGGNGNTNAGEAAFLGGGQSNTITLSASNAVIVGGRENNNSGNSATIGGGLMNYANSDFATVGGGAYNYITNTAPVPGYETYTGGAFSSVIGGGVSNKVTALGLIGYGVVGEVYFPAAATVSGGWGNLAGACGATIGGGVSNAATYAYPYELTAPTVGGGRFNSASGPLATISGGHGNAASGGYAAIGGGEQNWADGDYAVVPGGRGNRATHYAFAAGRRAKATNTGAFVWADSQDNDFASAIDNQFLIRAQGGVGINTNDTAGCALFVNGDLRVSGRINGQVVDGFFNDVTGLGSTVGGGRENTASDDFATIGGGSYNTASGYYATIGGGHHNTNSGYSAAIGGGEDNTASGTYATIGGGRENSASGTYATIGGGQTNTASDYLATVGGGSYNTASGYYATISGGHQNTNSGYSAAIGGGEQNWADGDYAVVPGGRGNRATHYAFAAGRRAKATNTGAFVWADSQDNDFASAIDNQFLIRAQGGVGINTNDTAGCALFVNGDLRVSGRINGQVVDGFFNDVTGLGSTVGGGRGNTASDDFATIGGGYTNAASGWFATIGGGGGNTASDDFATVGGGSYNTASCNRATIGGGSYNTASGNDATIGGGYTNAASGTYATIGGGGHNVASGWQSTVGGGSYNTASGNAATIGGGSWNAVSGDYAVVPGGLYNAATNYAFASGRRAKATNTGAFVWADSTDADFASTTNNQFLIRASGGVGINTNNPGTNALSVNGTARFEGPVVVVANGQPTNLQSALNQIDTLNAEVAALKTRLETVEQTLNALTGSP